MKLILYRLKKNVELWEKSQNMASETYQQVWDVVDGELICRIDECICSISVLPPGQPFSMPVVKYWSVLHRNNPKPQISIQ